MKKTMNKIIPLKTFAIFLFMLVILSVSAVAVGVYISPEPLTENDLTCNVVDYPNAQNLFYAWFMNDDAQRGLSGVGDNVLDSDETEVDDEWRCDVYIANGNEWANPWHIGQNYSSTVTIIENNAPEIDVPDQETNEDTSMELNIDDYSDDADDDELTYEVIEQVEDEVLCEVDENILAITPAQDWNGNAQCTITADDGNDGITEDVIAITVNAVNDAPVLAELPDQVLQEDSGRNEDLFNLFDFASDVDTPEDELVFEITEQSNEGVVVCEIDDEINMDCTTQDDQYGISDVTVSLSDGELLVEQTFRVAVEEVNELIVTGIECFQRVVLGHDQSCSVYVTDQNDVPVRGAEVSIYYDDDSEFGRCTTDITGGCEAQDLQEELGEFTVYATAELDGYEPDNDNEPSYAYEVIEERYTLTDLRIYNSPDFPQDSEDYDFFRNEDMYASFRVFDNQENEYVTENIVTSAALVSPPGGRAELEFMEIEGDGIRYALEPIPPTHDFLGESQTFAFAFNEDDEGGEAEVDLIIRNNLPEIRPLIEDILTDTETPVIIDLSGHEYDIEDNNPGMEDDSLAWHLSDVNNDVLEAIIDGKTLTINPVSAGEDLIILILEDLDGDTSEQEVLVTITEELLPRHDVALIDFEFPEMTEEGQQILFSSAVTNTGDFTETTILRFFIDDEEQEECRQEIVELEAETTTEEYGCMWLAEGVGMHSLRIMVDAVEDERNLNDNIVEDELEVIGELPELSAVIRANPVEGRPPLRVRLLGSALNAVGDISYRWTFDDGTGSQSYRVLYHLFEKQGIYTVTLTVTDSLGRSATASQVITVSEEDKDYMPRRRVRIGRVNILTDPYFSPGDYIPIRLNFENTGISDIEDVKVVVGIPELGTRRSVGPFDVDVREDAQRTILLELPPETLPGVYTVRIVLELKDKNLKRVKHREITVLP